MASPGSRLWEDGGKKVRRKCSWDQHLGKGKKEKGRGGEGRKLDRQREVRSSDTVSVEASASSAGVLEMD